MKTIHFLEAQQRNIFNLYQKIGSDIDLPISFVFSIAVHEPQEDDAGNLTWKVRTANYNKSSANCKSLKGHLTHVAEEIEKEIEAIEAKDVDDQ